MWCRDFSLTCAESGGAEAVPANMLCWDLVFHPDEYAAQREASSRRRDQFLLFQLNTDALGDASILHSAHSKAKAEAADKAACLAALAAAP